MDLSDAGLEVYPPSNKPVSGSPEELLYEMTTEGDKIVRMYADWAPGVGIGAMLKELGLV